MNKDYQNIEGYTLIKKYTLNDINSEGYYYKHIKSGARVACISNDDKNKCFNIAFRTPVSNSTGVPHIMEHSVLCGSKKYPLKDPFVELVKGSLNTFINAMTYDDKTTYPVASINDKDFKNLMDVYLDAVFNPNVYVHDEIFRQEGWSYQMETKDSLLEYNGVVYSEMKGAFSDPDSFVNSEVNKYMFPDTNYGFESGGNPDVIPELTYEDFLNFHKRYYHPSNSFIYLYGDMDIEENLKKIDEEYLSAYDYKEIDSTIKLQKPFEKPKDVKIEYPISEDEDAEGKAILTYSVMLDTILNLDEYFAFDVINYCLIYAQGAILKQRLLDAGIGRDVNGGAEFYRYQTKFTVTVKDADISKKDEFIKIVEDTFKDIIKNGFNKDMLAASIESNEFSTREADFGSYPKGLIYGLNMLDTWLYDENRPFDIFDYSIFDEMRKGIKERYFEKLIEKYFVDNNTKLVLVAEPVKGLTAIKDAKLAKKLADIKASMSEEEIEKIVRDTKELKEYQETEEKDEDLRKIPVLSLSDISKKSEIIPSEERKEQDIDVLFHEMPTNKIAYIDCYFGTNCVEDADISYLGLLRDSFIMMSTKKHNYVDLGNVIYQTTGRISKDDQIYGDYNNLDKYKMLVGLRCKTLYKNIDKACELINEILTETVFDDGKRLKEIIGTTKLNYENYVSTGGRAAGFRALSYSDVKACIIDRMSGIGYYRFLYNLDEHFDELKDEIVSSLRRIVQTITKKQNMFINITCDDEGYKLFAPCVSILTNNVSDEPVRDVVRSIIPEKKNEGFKTSSQVQYVLMTGNYRKAGYKPNGSYEVLGKLMDYEYMWKNIRVKGGAYGCGLSATASGDMYFSSYRDPNLKNTIEVYKKTPEYLRSFIFDKREMDKLVIGTISRVDHPLTPFLRSNVALSRYFTNFSNEELQKRRNEILATDVDAIRALADPVEAVLKQNYLCTVGSESKIEEDKDVFMTITGLAK